MQDIKLVVGDCANLTDLIDEAVGLVVTSPPYNIGPKESSGRILWRGVAYDGHDDQMDEEVYQDWQVHCLQQMYQVAKDGASLFYNHKVRNRNGCGIHPLAWLLRDDQPWAFRQQVVWDRGSTHNHEQTYFYPVDELIFWLTKGKPYLSPDGAKMGTVWRFPFATNTWHPAPFPVELPMRCIVAASRPGDLVLDPFVGSGTTCRAAHRLGRRSIGVDISAAYIERARLEYVQLAMPLL
jgi:DNA modification methylase